MKKRSAAASSSNSSSDSSSLTSNSKRPTTKNPKAKTKSPPIRTSVHRGVTRHRWTGRFEAHLWDKETWNSVQTKKGRQVYLGAYDSEEAAAKTYDLAAIKYWGRNTSLNFPMEMYDKEIEEMQKLSREEYLATLRRRSSGFSRGVSKFRGVAKHHHNGRWEARIGRVLGNKYLYLGTYSTQEEAAAAYDRAAIQYRGANAVTNFDISSYANLLVKEEGDQVPQPLNLKAESDAQEQENKKCAYINAEDDMNHGMMNEHDLSWDDLPIPNYSESCCELLECEEELPALFEDYIGFEDNLDFMFSSSGLEV